MLNWKGKTLTYIKALLIILIILLLISLFVYEEYYMVKPCITDLPLSIIDTDILLINALKEILQDSNQRGAIYKALLLHHSSEISEVPSCNIQIIYIKYYLSFLDIDPLQYRIGIRFSLDYESISCLMQQCLEESNALLVKILFRLLKSNTLDNSICLLIKKYITSL